MAHRIKEYKDVQLEYDAVSGLTFKFSTDMPGNALALRKTLSFPASSGRKSFTLPLDGTEGNLYQPRIESSGVVKLYAGMIRMREIGTYFDGAQGEFWECPPQAA